LPEEPAQLAAFECKFRKNLNITNKKGLLLTLLQGLATALFLFIHLQVNKTTGFAGEYRKIFRNSL